MRDDSWLPFEHELHGVSHIPVGFDAEVSVDLGFFDCERLKFESERECATDLDLRFKRDISVKLLAYLLRYDQSEPHSVFVHLGRILQKPERFKDLWLILLRDSDAGVPHANFENNLLPYRFDVHNNLDLAIGGELEGIALET